VPITSKYSRALTVGDLSFGIATSIDSSAGIPFSESIAAAKTGSLATRTNNTDGTLTMAGGHGITTGQRLDIFWAGGSRVGAVVGTVATNSVPFTGGSGDNLPIATTAITACVPTSLAFAVTGNNVVVLACGTDGLGGAVTFTDSGNTLIFSRTLTPAVKSYVWCSVDGGTNPLAGGAVAKVFLSNASASVAQDVSGVAQYN
jgi:hypothetical protein